VTIHDLPGPGQHIRKRAESGKAGDGVLMRGRPIRAAEIAVLSSVGRTHPRVYRRPVVRVLSTGDEIVDPGSTPLDHQLRNSNSSSLLAQLRELGIEGHPMGIAPDETDALARTLAVSLDADVLLVTGGVSVGDYDLVSSALETHGMRLLFHGVAVKPGKPILVGRCGRCLVVGLPGNPVSTFAGFAVFVAPALRRMLGYREWRNSELSATLDRPLKTDRKRQTYHLAQVAPSPDGLTVRAVQARGSGDVLALARANAFVVTTASGRDLEVGTRVPILLWRDLGLG
jgi:molybdopterin molybdotransferase